MAFTHSTSDSRHSENAKDIKPAIEDEEFQIPPKARERASIWPH